MPIDPATPVFPLHESLVRFFTADPRQPVPVFQAAALLGTSTEHFRSMLDREGGGTRDAVTITWAETAAYLFDAWPLGKLLDTLGPDHSHRVPLHYHPTRVSWSIPIYIVRAMEHQAAAEWRRDPRVQHGISPNHTAARGVDDYVSTLLFSEIQRETVFAFREDRDFLAAYDYPGRD